MTSEDMGKSFLTLDMDQTRDLRWNFAAIQRFENRCRDILRKLDLYRPGMALHAGFILPNYLKIAEIMEAALGAATGLSWLAGKNGEPSEAAVAIQAYLDRGGSLDALQIDVLKSFMMLNDPSMVGKWEAELERKAETKRIKIAAEEADIQIARQELAAKQKLLIR